MSEHSGSSGETTVQIASPEVIEDLGDMGVREIVGQLKELGLGHSEDGDSSGMDPMYTSGKHSYSDDQSSYTTINNGERYAGSLRSGRSTPTRTLASTRKEMRWLRLIGQSEKITHGTGTSFTKDRMYVG